ncbi:DUF262 domain-containing protein [Winogradskyella thalassocola]|uniref:GmrSD restriction endonucleases N-terminal domain-containing protein n=1 Tax=Winogradskyella thalassocola TaxID=262004 RepID=A0A1G8B9Q9_9FLAO|nr:DUF262 domain-containing protein [Winogradskyella thalassocola]SDH29947.1 Protein of unknown function DUF262 [Winogradskyella thalassocola]
MINKPTSFFELIDTSKIVIPIIQRDYAQGRTNEKVVKIRSKFLDALFVALENPIKPIELDFIYGYNLNGLSSKSFIPLDGQQRLTTLFLLHWYAAFRENKQESSKKVLTNFTYEVRHSSKVFCESLVNYIPENKNEDIKKQITNQSWFFTEWHNDPTVASMLVMLSSIQDRYETLGKDNIWDLLVSDNSPIKFYNLPMEKLGLADSLYIKMNSRGKPLTEFEHFKSQFSSLIPERFQQEFNEKIDKEWSDLFWKVCKNIESNDDLALKMDDGILNFIEFVTDILIALDDLDIASSELLKKAEIVYGESDERLEFLFSSLNKFVGISDIDTYFESLFYLNPSDFDTSKVRLFFRNPNVNLLEKCVTSYGSAFVFGERLLLFAVLIHQLKDTEKINDRLRIIRNLIENSEYEMRSDLYKEFLESTKAIVENGVIPEDSKFNAKQRKEEANKEIFINENLEFKNSENQLEDHNFLRGNLALFNLDTSINNKAHAFIKLFSNEFYLLSRALMTFGDYAKKTKEWVFDYGSHNGHWLSIFTPSRNIDFTQTKQAVNFLLESYLSNKKSLEQIIEDYLKTFELDNLKPKTFAYYFIKYQSFLFHEGQDGYYSFRDRNQKSKYELYKMNKLQFNGFHWSPFLLEIKNHVNKVTLENGYLSPLILSLSGAKFNFTCVSSGYHIEINNGKNAESLFQNLKDKFTINEDNVLEINQNEEGIDIEDRVVKGIEVIKFIIDNAK